MFSAVRPFLTFLWPQKGHVVFDNSSRFSTCTTRRRRRRHRCPGACAAFIWSIFHLKSPFIWNQNFEFGNFNKKVPDKSSNQFWVDTFKPALGNKNEGSGKKRRRWKLRIFSFSFLGHLSASPLRRFAASPLRRFAASPLRRFVCFHLGFQRWTSRSSWHLSGVLKPNGK